MLRSACGYAAVPAVDACVAVSAVVVLLAPVYDTTAPIFTELMASALPIADE